ncbi:MAG TPA: tRNA (adenosine(37)-N6)-dimethylallyltransferase MiaA [Candidatus Sulfotelmatobacter sp.]|jgi:tRNA dimethylallyltransferase|nr:tRNA (adenosine(37)-N6)-dimethylallyltransferase MiaA [Candidatus Sulfotelmatobacter sp.]
MKKAIVVAGPTASGKSALALTLAEQLNGVVINADSMQIYDVLRVVTARPSVEDEARAPHRLYGMLQPAELCSAGRWRSMAAAEMETAWAEGRLPVVVGGTGLYLRALVQGLSPIPDIPDDVRQAARALFEQMGNEAFHALLASRDPVIAARLHPSNSQRLVRAWEVAEATGRTLSDWQTEPPADTLDAAFHTILIAPEREALYAGCDRRFEIMMEQGALDEVRRITALNLDPALPAMKALGVPELAAHLAGRVTLQHAVAQAQQSTRNYAKRQSTWFRHQLQTDTVLSTQFSERFFPEIFAKIRLFLLTADK